MNKYMNIAVQFVKENPKTVKVMGSAIGSVIGTIVAAAILKHPVFAGVEESLENVIEGSFVDPTIE